MISESSKSSRWSGVSHQIAIVLPTGEDWSSSVKRGIADFARTQGTWDLQWLDAGLNSLEAITQLRPQGILAHLEDETLVLSLMMLGRPVVAVNQTVRSPKISSVAVDNYAIGMMAAEHFARRGMQNFACLSFAAGAGEQRRCEGFIEFVQQQSTFQWTIYRLQGRNRPAVLSPTTDNPQIRQWLIDLPKPIGVFVVSDLLGLSLCEICRAVGLRVPHDVAIIGADDDENVCLRADPILSSISSPFSQIGYEAAQCLADHLASRMAPVQHRLLRPTGVTVRRSCDVCAIDDVEIAEVLRLIYGMSGKPLGMKEILKRVPMSRRSLEQRFRAVTGRSPGVEIRRMSLEQAARLLTNTSDSIDKIALLTGFSCGTHLSVAFTREYGISPNRFRKTHGNDDATT